jgi:hypothetical protein
MMQKSITFTTIFRVKRCYVLYDFSCKKVPISLRYAKKVLYYLLFLFFSLFKSKWPFFTHLQTNINRNFQCMFSFLFLFLFDCET